MKSKIYEYKDENDWYIGQVEKNISIDSFEKQSIFQHFKQIFEQLITKDKETENQGFQITVIKYSSKFKFLKFIINILNENYDYHFELIQHQGAILLTEKSQILHVELPQNGLPLETFFQNKEKLGDTILIATRNEGKTREFREFFSTLGYGVENLNEYPELPEVDETGTTFEENARLKAETIANLTGKIVLADDSGLKVDALGGLPGVWSARFSGPNSTDEENNHKLLHELSMVFNLKDRAAQFHTTLVLAKPNKESLVVEADWPGYIGFEAKGDNGFGYDPIFLVGETGNTSAELTLKEKNKQSHRARALEKLLEAFPKW